MNNEVRRKARVGDVYRTLYRLPYAELFRRVGIKFMILAIKEGSIGENCRFTVMTEDCAMLDMFLLDDMSECVYAPHDDTFIRTDKTVMNVELVLASQTP